ncbi:hypothetical protein L6V77_01250 [Myxococcota bacterium]|nr:hypothetical protein [Myxococcota bacterium]
MAIFEIYADEAWTHGGEPLNRYWCFFGGILGLESALDRLNTDLGKIKASHQATGEVKWTNVKASNLQCCKDMVDCVAQQIREGHIRYRQMFLDRQFVRIAPNGEVEADGLTVQFKLFYQFLKHAFGLKYLPVAPHGEKHRILVRLDDHSSLKHKNGLRSFVENLPNYWGRHDLSIEVTFVNSTRNNRLQICDLMMGAAGSHGNKAEKRRKPGQRGMTPKQKIKAELAKHIYDQLRQLNLEMCGSTAFNWFETKSLCGDFRNVYAYSIRMWKFKPARYQIDEGWTNAYLDSQGRYLGPRILPEITRSSDDGETTW